MGKNLIQPAGYVSETILVSEHIKNVRILNARLARKSEDGFATLNRPH
jgi:hypothetical protein